MTQKEPTTNVIGSILVEKDPTAKAIGSFLAEKEGFVCILLSQKKEGL